MDSEHQVRRSLERGQSNFGPRTNGRYHLGALKVLVGRSCEVVWGTLWRPWRHESRWGGVVPEFVGDLGGQGGERAAQGAELNGQTTRAKRYAHYGLEDTRAKMYGKHNIS